MISVDVNYKENHLNKKIKKDNFKKDLINLIEANHQININIFYINMNLQLKIKKAKKDIHQAPKPLRMPEANLKTIRFNNI